MKALELVALGERNPNSLASEVWLLGSIEPGRLNGAFVSISEGEWESVDANVGYDLKVGKALKSERGVIRMQSDRALDVYLLRHPWSGLAAVRYQGRTVHLDLYAPQTSVVCFNAHSGEVRDVSKLEVKEVFPEVDRKSIVNVASLTSIMGVEPIRVEVSSMRSAVRLVFAGPTIDAPKVDLASCVTSSGWRLSGTEGAERAFGHFVLEGEAGEIILSGLTDDASLIFARGPGAGKVAIRMGTKELLVNLAGVDGFCSVSVRQLNDGRQQLAELPKYTQPSRIDEAKQLDPYRPVGLFVPRWKGVAMSTRSLFDQWLAFPPIADGHPDDLVDLDIERYAKTIIQSGGRHFVVSGGDLFWIDMIRKVRKEKPEIRFDLLWHSNYAQMGEVHDWKLWTGWLAALREGLVTRIGVVKEGYDVFLRSIGFDAVFVPNAIQPGTIPAFPVATSNSIGLWLSGSSDYRKPVYPALMALGFLERYSLSAAGIGDIGLRLASRLGLKITQISANPLSPNVLYRSMATTCATLYTTLSECSPMLPLESFALGVPCLVGPSSHLFRDHNFLAQSLIVRNPMDPREIASKLEGVVAHRSAIITAYQQYADEELMRSKDALARLVA